MGIWHFRNELAKNLPYGDQRRVEIARALATEPPLLILDEPAAGLNEQESAELMALIRQIRDTGDHRPADRARHEGGDGHFRPDRGAGQRREDRRGHAGRGAGQPAGDRGLSGARREAEVWPMPGRCLQMRDVHTYYGHVHALKGISPGGGPGARSSR